METQVIISKKEYESLIKLKEQLKKFEKEKPIYIGSISSYRYNCVDIGSLHLLIETDVIKILLQKVDNMQSRIEEIAKERDKYASIVKLKWWQSVYYF